MYTHKQMVAFESWANLIHCYARPQMILWERFRAKEGTLFESNIVRDVF